MNAATKIEVHAEAVVSFFINSGQNSELASKDASPDRVMLRREGGKHLAQT